MLKYLFLFIVITQSTAFAQVRLRPAAWASDIIGSDLDNFYQLTSNIYRSEQPGSKAFRQIEKFGIGEVLNLRQHHTDNDETKETSLVLHRVPIRTGNISYPQILQALQIIKNAEKPILIHCWHGSDRTGVICASYRIIFQDWSKKEAIDEFKNGGYGYHKRIYSKLIKVIEKLDIKFFKEKLGVKHDHENPN